MTIKVAIITGISGQDGSYLAELLIKKNILYMEYATQIKRLILSISRA